jgi:hypothetical protein
MAGKIAVFCGQCRTLAKCLAVARGTRYGAGEETLAIAIKVDQ